LFSRGAAQAEESKAMQISLPDSVFVDYFKSGGFVLFQRAETFAYTVPIADLRQLPE